MAINLTQNEKALVGAGGRIRLLAWDVLIEHNGKLFALFAPGSEYYVRQGQAIITAGERGAQISVDDLPPTVAAPAVAPVTEANSAEILTTLNDVATKLQTAIDILSLPVSQSDVMVDADGNRVLLVTRIPQDASTPGISAWNFPALTPYTGDISRLFDA